MAEFNEKTYNSIRDPDKIDVWGINKGFITMDGYSSPQKNTSPSPKLPSPSSSTGYSYSGSSNPPFLLQTESFIPFTSHIIPVLTGLYGATKIYAAEFTNASSTEYLIFLCSALACYLRSKSKILTQKNKEASNYGLTACDKAKLLGLNALHFSSFVCLATVYADTLSKTVSEVTHPDNAALIVSGACCVYQAAAIAIKKTKLNIKE